MTDQPKPQRGGLRNPPGGRPPGKAPARRKMVSIKLPVELVDRLKRESNKTALIERLLREHYGV